MCLVVRREIMAVWRFSISNAMALALSISSSYAGPCTPEIGQLRAGIEVWLAAGPSAPQSVAAMLHHQPTPSSVAAAQERLARLSAQTIAALTHGTRGACRQRAASRSTFRRPGREIAGVRYR
jgi:hypothetical protein